MRDDLFGREVFQSIVIIRFASKQAKSHKWRIWCRLRGNTRCNHPFELD